MYPGKLFLHARLQWRGQAPSCLHRVLYLMEQTGQLRLLQETEEGRVSGWFSWGISVVSRPIKWFWRGYLSPNNPALGNGVFVDTQLLQVRVIKIDVFSYVC